MGRDGSNRIRWWWLPFNLGRPDNFPGGVPLDTFIASELERDSSCCDRLHDIDENVPVDNITRKVEWLVDLDEEVRHGIFIRLI